MIPVKLGKPSWQRMSFDEDQNDTKEDRARYTIGRQGDGSHTNRSSQVENGKEVQIQGDRLKIQAGLLRKAKKYPIEGKLAPNQDGPF